MIQPGSIVRADDGSEFGLLGYVVGFTHHHNYGRIVMVKHPNGVGVVGYEPYQVRLNNPPTTAKSEPMADDGLDF